MRSYLMAGVLAAGVLGFAATALEGEYTGPSGTKIVFDDGVIHVTPVEGPAFDDTYEIDRDTLSVTSSDADANCPGVVGTYTFEESETGATFTLVEDTCQPRIADATSGEWVKTQAEDE